MQRILPILASTLLLAGCCHSRCHFDASTGRVSCHRTNHHSGHCQFAGRTIGRSSCQSPWRSRCRCSSRQTSDCGDCWSRPGHAVSACGAEHRCGPPTCTTPASRPTSNGTSHGCQSCEPVVPSSNGTAEPVPTPAPPAEENTGGVPPSIYYNSTILPSLQAPLQRDAEDQRWVPVRL